ncbi:hypothetical protein A6R68_21209 [Neotoma lepida]|uniref:Teneurin N-terminal domain-containing protein n=1 Tax=Neotoma lepida TaxID=56216 RepID=A0A1A6HS91_NEOLE|nr:hypothetical protein A6R68_21209 [Neotoma lepida]
MSYHEAAAVLKLAGSGIQSTWGNLGKQPFLGTLQDNLIEMDILSASRHDGAYSDGHFLFKPGGTSPLFCTSSPGYPLTSSTVYSPPPRPLPRSTFSRPAFNLKKPSKYCNWKCAALSAIVISATLVILLAYFVEKSASEQHGESDMRVMLCRRVNDALFLAF